MTRRSGPLCDLISNTGRISSRGDSDFQVSGWIFDSAAPAWFARSRMSVRTRDPNSGIFIALECELFRLATYFAAFKNGKLIAPEFGFGSKIYLVIDQGEAAVYGHGSVGHEDDFS